MKRKRFFNRKTDNRQSVSNLKTAYREISNELKPVFKKIRSGFMHILNKNPKRTFICMMVFLLTNFFALYFFTNNFRSSKGIKFSMLASGVYHSKFLPANSHEIPDIDFSIANYRKAVELKDSLQYLIGKKKLSYSDTVLFVSIMDQFNELTKGRDKSIPKITIEDVRKVAQRDSIHKK